MFQNKHVWREILNGKHSRRLRDFEVWPDWAEFCPVVAEFSNFGTSKISVGRVGGYGRNFTLPTFILISNTSKNKLFPEMGRFSEMVGWAQLAVSMKKVWSHSRNKVFNCIQPRIWSLSKGAQQFFMQPTTKPAANKALSMELTLNYLTSYKCSLPYMMAALYANTCI